MILLGHTSALEHAAYGVLGAGLLAVYGAGWVRMRAASRRRLWSWVAGIVAMLLASAPWMEGVAERTFTGHMCQHLLVIVVAAPLLVVAQPVRTIGGGLGVASTGRGRRLAAGWRRAAPLLAPLCFIGALFVTHLTSIYDEALGNRLVHEVEHAAYLLGALAVWSAVLAPGRGAAAARAAVAFAVTAGGSLLGMILLSAPEPLIDTYATRLGVERALDDQRAAAALMWISGMATTVPLLIVAVWRWASTEDRIAHRAEALTDGQVAFTRRQGGSPARHSAPR